MWWVPTVISAVCIVGGAGAAARWLPDLASGTIGGLAFLLVCGLLAGALDLAALHVYSTVKDLESASSHFTGQFLASDLELLLRDVGILAGFAGVIFLIAPKPSGEPAPSDAPVSSDQA
jgi:hypothetical protein